METTSQRAKRIATKLGLDKKLSFRRGAQPASQYVEVYSNSSAAQVPMPTEGPRPYFQLDRVQWLRIDKNRLIGSGAVGDVHVGKVKFFGISKPKTVVVKSYRQGSRSIFVFPNFQRLIERLRSSNIPHPKMAYLPAKGSEPERIIMEPFLKAGKSKMLPNQSNEFIHLRLQDSRDHSIFRQALEIAAELSKQGIQLKEARDGRGNPRIDAFTVIELPGKVFPKMGSAKVILQDLDALHLHDQPHDPKHCWRVSTGILYNIIIRAAFNSGQLQDRDVAEQLIKKIGQKHGLE